MAVEPKERAEGLLVIDDGYTLAGVCRDADGAGRRPLRFRYRPALPEAVYEYRQKAQRAEDGGAKLAAVVALLAAHVESWEGVARRGPGGLAAPVPFLAPPGPGRGAPDCALADPRVRLAVGVEYLDQMVNFVCGYAPGEWEADAGNS